MNNILNIGKRREPFWDDFLIDTNKTTAFFRVMNPEKKECCFEFVEKPETYATSYPCILKDDKGYKMYFMPWNEWENIGEYKEEGGYLAVAESTDGINWTRPELNIFPRPELKINNIVIEYINDGFFVFIDNNPACPEDEKYKAVGAVYIPGDEEKRYELWCYTSADGYHFEKKHMMTDKGRFDSLNTVLWENGQYSCYLRNFHDGIRDIRVMYSEDFTNWTEPQMLEFEDGQDYPLYTNNIMIYDRAPHMRIGFPVRYCERKVWTENEDQIGSKGIKKAAIEQFGEPRAGLAVTDNIFICSRDQKRWYRYNEAFLKPGYENENNWVYGDCYMAYGIVDSGKETYYMYCHECHRNRWEKKPFYRYEIRKDGFACMMADGEERIIVTKPLIFEGKDLHINFETSAFGYIYVDVLNEDGNPLTEKQSFEVYGNSIDRKINFSDGSDFSEFSGKPVRLRFRMRDSKLFSLYFE